TFALDRLVVGDVLLELNSTAEAGVYEGHCFCGGPLSVSQNRDLKVDLRENPSTIKLPGLPTYVHTLIRVDPEGLKPPR
ncbi:MAG: hypothetical protein KDH09_09125, partial [Chrysiogenetes bacterium]|nr:hypothetical protein [Chrysiogenetes bacterium]